MSWQTRFPIPLSIRSCDFPAHGLPTGFSTWLRSLRVANSAPETVQALVVEPVFIPAGRLAGTEVPPSLLDEQALQPPPDVAIKFSELLVRVPGSEVVAPTPKELVQLADDSLEVRTDALPAGEVSDSLSCPFHRTR